MARIVLGSYLVQFPMGGYLSWVLQWLVGFRNLGHEVVFVEKGRFPDSCYDPVKNVMTSDPSYGTGVVDQLFRRHGLAQSWCFVDIAGKYHGRTRQSVDEFFRTADLFIDMGTHGAWSEEAATTRLRVFIDGEPGATQIKMEKQLQSGRPLADYDFYFTVGQNIGTERSSAPTAGQCWRPIYYPVALELFSPQPIPAGSAFTTIMSWEAHEPVEWNGTTYGAKSTEFVKFLDLPAHTASPLEIAVAGRNVPHRELTAAGWKVRDSHSVTLSFDTFTRYIAGSTGEFSVCKNVFVQTNTGWFGDRAAAYLASARPVVMQETGFSGHLPCGRGLFAVRTVGEAAAAIDAIDSDPVSHSRWARDLAAEFLDTPVVLRRFLGELGIE